MRMSAAAVSMGLLNVDDCMVLLEALGSYLCMADAEPVLLEGARALYVRLYRLFELAYPVAFANWKADTGYDIDMGGL